MASPAVYAPGLRGNIQLTNWLAKATEMCFSVIWLLTPVSSNKDVLTLVQQTTSFPSDQSGDNISYFFLCFFLVVS